MNFRLLSDLSINSVAMANQQAVKATRVERITIPQDPKQFGIYIELDTSLTPEQLVDACRKMCTESCEMLASLDATRAMMENLVMDSYNEEKAAVEKIRQLLTAIHQLCNDNGIPIPQNVAGTMLAVPYPPSPLQAYKPTFLALYHFELLDMDLSPTQLSVRVTDLFQYYITEKALRELAQAMHFETEHKARNSLAVAKRQASDLEVILKDVKRSVSINGAQCSTAHLLLTPQVHNPP